MTIEEARAAIGQPFKWILCAQWDKIIEVSDDGYITGEIVQAPVEECRLKQPQPEHLKRNKELQNDKP